METIGEAHQEDPTAIVGAAIARVFLTMARGDLEGVAAAAAVRVTGRAEFVSFQGHISDRISRERIVADQIP